MLRTRKFWLPVALLTAAVLFNASYRVAAEKGATPPAKSPPPASPRQETQGNTSPIPEPGIMLRGKETQIAGKQGQATNSATMILRDLPQATGESSGREENEEREVKAPGREPEPPPMPNGWQHPFRAQPGVKSKSNSPTGANQHIFAGVPAPGPLSSFLAVDQGSGGSFPPDVHGAVGPNHVMTANNDRIRIQDRNGAIIRTVNIGDIVGEPSGFWGGALGIPANQVFDPRFLYDPYTQRWIAVSVAYAEQANSSILIAASATSDPTGLWFRFQIDVDNSGVNGGDLWADFPCVGFNANWITVSVNMFGNVSGTLVRPKVYAFQKAPIYAGTGAPFTFYNMLVPSGENGVGTTIFPATTYSASEQTQYLVNRFNETNGALAIYSISGTVAMPSFNILNLNPVSPIPWAHFGGMIGFDFAPQAGSFSRIDNGDSRMQSVVFRNGSLWCAHTIFYPTGTSASRSAVQWWQLSPTSATVQQRGVIDDPGGNTFYAYPSIAVNVNNDALIGYSRFSGTQFASANYSFRVNSDPLNTLREDATLKAGEGFYYQVNNSSNRWGDYSATVVDPTNDLDMWTLQEYALPPQNTTISGRWSSWWVRVRSDGAPAPPAAAPQVTPSPNPNPPAPANDLFAGAQIISGCTGSVTGQNYNANPMKESGEPDHGPPPGNNPGGKSIWYRWTAPASGQVTITTDGSNFDTLLAVYTGNPVANLTAIIKNDDGPIGLTSRVNFAVTSGTVYQIAVAGFFDNRTSLSDFGDVFLNWSLEAGGCAPATTVQFSRAAYTTLESTGVAVLTLTRSGSLFGITTVDYQTVDGTATQLADYTTVSGTVTFTSGQAIQTLAIPITDDSYVESSENLTVNMSSPVGGSLGANSSATLTIANNDTPNSPTNPIENGRFFVRQQYADFLSREPDQGGFDFWASQFIGLSGTAYGMRRTAVSNAFFFELEYQQTGAYVYRLYRAAFGNTQPFPNPMGDMDSNPYCTANPNNCQLIRAAHVPSYERFASDRARLNASQLPASQLALATAFTQRSEFVARYPVSQTAEQFVDALISNIQAASGANLTGQRANLIGLFNSGGRGAVLFRLAEDNQAGNPINNRAFIDAEYNRAFVTTQYFGYLRRNADMPGLNFWLSVVNQFPLRSATGQNGMVCAFITSAEYQQRFSPLTPRSNSECQ